MVLLLFFTFIVNFRWLFCQILFIHMLDFGAHMIGVQIPYFLKRLRVIAFQLDPGQTLFILFDTHIHYIFTLFYVLEADLQRFNFIKTTRKIKLNNYSEIETLRMLVQLKIFQHVTFLNLLGILLCSIQFLPWKNTKVYCILEIDCRHAICILWIHPCIY